MKPHWPEYFMEALALGLFLVSACVFGVVLEHPASPIHRTLADPLMRRLLMGLAMGATAVTLILSPFGQRSGAHMNPAVTLTFLRLGKIAPADAAGYIAGQFAGAVCGVALVAALLAAVRDPQVNYVATQPGAHGPWMALAAEILISFGMMTLVLRFSNSRRLARYTPWAAGALVALYITLEAPVSGMSMNPARTFGSAFSAHLWNSWWIYFAGPLLGMLLAAELYVRTAGIHRVFCAKLHHHNNARCLFRCRFHQLAGAMAALILLVSPAAAQRVAAVDSVAITVANLDRSTEFFTKVLDFEKVAQREAGPGHRVARLKLGQEFIELHAYSGTPGRPVPPDHRGNDRLFQHAAIIVSDMDRAYQRLRAHKVRHASSGPQRLPDWNPNAGGIKAFYFRDPDGHFLEILEFPPGKGDARWQSKDRLFLGIDHTAIVVASTDDSLAFYRGRLGLRVAGESENHGFEQEHLNNVFGARLRITALRAPSGPGIELLEYLSPTDGRPFPADLRPNDLAWWQTQLVIEPGEPIPRAATVPDPDGHRLVLTDRKGGDL